jgi:hypothetical protein
MKKLVGSIVLVLCVVGGLLLTPGNSFAQATPGIQIFDDDVNGITVNLFNTFVISNSNLVINQERRGTPGSVIWDFDYFTGLPPATYSYNIFEQGASPLVLSDTLQFTRTSVPCPVQGCAHGHLEFFSDPPDETFLVTALPNAAAIIETGALQTPPNGPADLSPFQFQSDLDTTSVPEPMSLFLFGAGLVGMAAIGGRNRREGNS